MCLSGCSSALLNCGRSTQAGSPALAGIGRSPLRLRGGRTAAARLGRAFEVADAVVRFFDLRGFVDSVEYRARFGRP